jgi:predicted secreted hydrolase
MIGRRSVFGRCPWIGALLVGVAAAACAGAPILANPAVVPPAPSAPTPTIGHRADPQPVSFPRDDGPHHRLTEWWYFTGHLVAADGRRFGFEDVVFRAERGTFPVSWASHLALTDEADGRFLYAQRSEIGPHVDRASVSGAASSAFAFAIAGSDASGIPATQPPWEMRRDGRDATLRAATAGGESTLGGAPVGAPSGPAFGLDLQLGDSPAVLHGSDGWVDFGSAGGSYYYSRMRQAASGSVTIDGRSTSVTGTAWFDHQWGDFISVGGGGWDWFAVNLADRTDLTLSLVRAADGSYPLVYGTLVRPTGEVVHLDANAFRVTATGRWTSARTSASYPAGWHVSIPGEAIEVDLSPTVAAQELDTRPTTGVTYWEGSQHVRATRAGRPVDGEAYVELTGYGPAG